MQQNNTNGNGGFLQYFMAFLSQKHEFFPNEINPYITINKVLF